MVAQAAGLRLRSWEGEPMSRPVTVSLIACLTAVASLHGAPPEPPRPDRLGDPLPPRAVARLGTHRLCFFGPGAMALAPDASAPAVSEEFHHEISLSELPSGKLRWAAPLPRMGAVHGNGSIGFSPDGKMLALAHTAGDLHVWEARTGRLLHTLHTPGSVRAASILFSPDSRKLAHTDMEAIHVFDLATGKRLSTWKVDDSLNSFAWSADSCTLVVGDRDRISHCEVATGKHLRSWRLKLEDDAQITDLSPDGKQVAVLVNETGLRVHDAASGGEKFRAWVKGPFSSGAVFSSDGRRLAARAKDVLHVWDTATWKLLHSVLLQPGDVESFVLSADGGTVAFCNCRPELAVHVWDMAKKRPLREFPGHRCGGLGVAFSADGAEVVTAEEGTWFFGEVHPVLSLRRWDAATGEEKLRLVKDVGEVQRAVLSGDGRLVGLALSGGMLALWDAEDGRELRRWPLPYRVEASKLRPGKRLVPGAGATFAFTRTSDELLVGHYPKLHRWDVGSGKELASREVPGIESREGPYLVVLPRNRLQNDGWVAVHQFPARWVQLLDSKTGRLGPRFEDGESYTADQALTADGRMLAALHEEKIRLWEVASASPRGEVRGGSRDFGVLALSPDSRLLAVSAENRGEILLYDLAAARMRAILKGHRGAVSSLAFSPDSRRLVSGAEDNVAYIWDVTGTTPAERLDDKQLERLWRDLHSADGAAAYHAIWRLASDPEHGVPFLRQHLLTPSADGPRMARLIEQLSHDSFKVREAASADLAHFGTLAVPALVAAKKGKLSPEGHRRINDLLAKLPRGTPPSAALVGIRVIESLERAGTPEARQALEEIGKQAMWRDEVPSTLRRMGAPRATP
jgi:WD40 repeat protein